MGLENARSEDPRSYLLASVTSTGSDEVQFLYRALGERSERVLASRTRGLFTQSNPVFADPGTDSGAGELNIIALRPGHYQLTGWRLKLGRTGHQNRWLAPAGLEPIGFAVRPNEVVYLGNLAVYVRYDEALVTGDDGFQAVRSAVAQIRGQAKRDVKGFKDARPSLASLPIRASVKSRQDWAVGVARKL